MNTTKHPTGQFIPLELTRDDLEWLRAFLNEGRISADHDYKKVESLHSALAIGAAQEALRSEHARMTKIVEAINKQLAVINEREYLARKADAALAAMADKEDRG
ncbi:MAG: hypothetical protein ACFN4K_05770 [Pauljensenia sp.]